MLDAYMVRVAATVFSGSVLWQWTRQEDHQSKPWETHDGIFTQQAASRLISQDCAIQIVLLQTGCMI